MSAKGDCLLLIRHAQTDWNLVNLIQGQRDDARLTAEGERQAVLLADQFGARGVTAIYSSDLSRAKATAAPLGDRCGLVVQSDSRLRERSLGTLEGRHTSMLGRTVSGIQDGRVVDAEAAPSGGESVRSLYFRVASFLTELLSRVSAGPSPQLVALVAHGGSLKVARGYLEATPVEGMSWPPLDNCAGWEFQLDEVRSRLAGVSA